MSTTSTDNWEQVHAEANAALTEPIVQYIHECRAELPSRPAT